MDKQPGYVPCSHCGDHEGKVGCPGCQLLVCGACALAACPRAALAEEPVKSRSGVFIDQARRTLSSDGDTASFADVIEVIVETQRFAGWTDLHYEYRVRIVLGDRAADFFPLRIRSLHPLADLDRLAVARGEALARTLAVPLRIERGG